MENTRTALSLNLSNQSNFNKAVRTELSQLNTFLIIGLEYLENITKYEGMPISAKLSKSGELTINGLNKELINDNNVYIYSDKKVTQSDDESKT